MRSLRSLGLDLLVGPKADLRAPRVPNVRTLLLGVLGALTVASMLAALLAPTEHRAQVSLWIAPETIRSLNAEAIAPLAQSDALKQATIAALSRRHGEAELRAALPAAPPADAFERLGALLVPAAYSSDQRLVAGLSRRLEIEATSPTTLVVTVTARDATVAADAALAVAADLSSRIGSALGRKSAIRQTASGVAAMPRFDGLTMTLAGTFALGLVGSAAFSRHQRARASGPAPAMPVTASMPAVGAEWVVARSSSERTRFPAMPGEDGHGKALAAAVWAALDVRDDPAKRLLVTGAEGGRLRLATDLAGEAARSGRRALIVDLAGDLAPSAEMVRAGFRELAAGLVGCDAAIARSWSGVHVMARGFCADAGGPEAVAWAVSSLEAAYDLVIVLADEHSDGDALEAHTYPGAVALIVAERGDARIWPRLDRLTAVGVGEALLCPLGPDAGRFA
ncbi:hypothetical protein [Amorphus sp. 3PC139-8]|uniref:hypothetical protein n=1 Tax=Amorphus sp. 3PC139-8 TaxID=2735676 RepID=UPI00345D9B3D